MTNKTNIQTEGGPTLFDGLTPQDPPANRQSAEPQQDPADDWVELSRLLDETRKGVERGGFYTLVPPEVLARRGELYYNQRIEQVAEALAASGMAAPDISAVTTDYARVTFGSLSFTASPATMTAALKALPPAKAAGVDLYGLYFSLMLNYARHVLTLFSYQTNVESKGATKRTKSQFLERFYSPAEALAVVWLSNNGYIEPSHFAGFETSQLGEFFSRIREFAALGEYTTYYTFCKYALLATPEELDQIIPPPIHAQTSLSDYANKASEQYAAELKRLSGKFSEAATSEPSPEQEQAREAAAKWDVNTVKIYPNYGIVLSRPVSISPNGSEIINTLPVQRYIDRFKKDKPQYSDITQMTVQKVFEGVNLLPTYLSRTMQIGDNGRYIYHTNISEFAEICGYADASQPHKTALLGGLLLLSNLYFVVDKPKRYVETTTRKGVKVRKAKGGRAALQFLHVPEIELETGELRIEVYPDSLKGQPTLITPETYKQLRAEAKGLTQSRFNAQIATKSHKSELDLIDEVFGFADMLRNATPEELPKVKKYVQGHRGRERSRLLGWFDDYLKAGIITEFKREQSKTNKRDFVLSWSCPEPDKLTPPPFDPDAPAIPQDPDEQ